MSRYQVTIEGLPFKVSAFPRERTVTAKKAGTCSDGSLLILGSRGQLYTTRRWYGSSERHVQVGQWSLSMAKLLRDWGLLTSTQFDRYAELFAEARKKNKRSNAIYELEEAAKELGIELTAKQKRKLTP